MPRLVAWPAGLAQFAHAMLLLCGGSQCGRIRARFARRQACQIVRNGIRGCVVQTVTTRDDSLKGNLDEFVPPDHGDILSYEPGMLDRVQSGNRRQIYVLGLPQVVGRLTTELHMRLAQPS